MFNYEQLRTKHHGKSFNQLNGEVLLNTFKNRQTVKNPGSDNLRNARRLCTGDEIATSPPASGRRAPRNNIVFSLVVISPSQFSTFFKHPLLIITHELPVVLFYFFGVFLAVG